MRSRRIPLPESFHRYPFLYLLAILVVGILLGEQFLPVVQRAFSLVALVITIVAVLVGMSRRQAELLFLLLVVLSLLAVGVARVYHPVPELYSHGQTMAIAARCENVFSPPNRYTIRHGDIRLLLQTPDSVYITPGDSIVVRAWVLPLATRAHVNEFDYDRYLRHQGFQAKAYTREPVAVVGHHDDFYTRCHHLRERLMGKLQQLLLDTSTLALLEALCLGYREHLHPDAEALFQTTGTVHILSISGLHMGALYLFLLAILRVLRVRTPRAHLCLIPILWFVVCLTGLSPSAARAAAILSLILFGKAFNYDYSPLNAVAAAAFFSLLANPYLLYSVSFQMSYAAYAGIILLYPPFSRLATWWPRFWRWIYNTLCVSLAAQLAIVPLTAYYFHTVNVTGILINLVAIPLGTLLLYGGILLLVLPVAMGQYLAPVVTFINKSLFFSLEQFQIINYNVLHVYPTTVHVLLLFLLLALAAAYFANRRSVTLRLICITASVLALFSVGWRYHQQTRQEVAVLHRYDRSAVILNYRGHYAFLKYTPSPLDTLPPPYVLARGLIPLPDAPGFVTPRLYYDGHLLVTKRDTFCIVDNQHPPLPVAATFLVTGNTPPPADSLLPRPCRVVLDGTNSSRRQDEWQRYCQRHGIPFLSTSTTGSLLLPLHSEK